MANFRGFYPPGFENIGRARRAVVNFAMSCGFFESALGDIETAVGEALGNSADPRRELTTAIHVHATFVDGEFTVDVQYEGEAFGAITGGADSGAVRGFSISIMRKCMDRVEFHDGGRRIRLVKRVRASGASRLPETPDASAADAV